MKRKKVLITGGNSKIGTDLVKFFLKKNQVVSTYRNKKIKLKNRNLKQVRYEFKNKFLLNEKFDYFIHCASSTPVNSKINRKMLEENLKGLKNILCSKSHFTSIVLISTVSVYGDISNNFIDENTKHTKLNYYGLSKLKMENYLKKIPKINYLILRLPGVIGNYKNKDNFINKIIFNISKNKSVVVHGPDTFFNNIVHTETIAKIINNFFIRGFPKRQVFNLCSKKPMRIKNLVLLIKKKLKSKSMIAFKPRLKNSFCISEKKCAKQKVKLENTNITIKKTLAFLSK